MGVTVTPTLSFAYFFDHSTAVANNKIILFSRLFGAQHEYIELW